MSQAVVDLGEFLIMKSVLEKTGLYDVSEGSVIYAELMAYAEGLDIYFNELERLKKECFVLTAEGEGLEVREAMFGRMNLDDSLSGRRNAIIKAMSVCGKDFDLSGMEKVRDSFNAHGTFSFDPVEFKVIFTCTDDLSASQASLLEEQMKVFMPCWAGFEVVN